MFVAALFMIANKWKLPKCPSANEWISKRWYIHTMECYSGICRNDALIHATVWMNSENIMLSEKSWTQKAMDCMILFI